MKNIHISGSRYEIEINPHEEQSLFYAGGLIITVTIIMLFGLTMLYSTSSYGIERPGSIVGARLFYSQLVWAFIGLCGGITVFSIGYQRLAKWSVLLMIASVILLLIAAIFMPDIKGAHRWIKFRLPGFSMSLQPSEFAKIAIALFLSKYCAENIRCINKWSLKRGFLPGATMCGVVIATVVLGKDLGTTLLLAATCAIVFFVAGMRLLYLLIPTVTVLPALWYYLKNYDPERWSRLTSFLHPELLQQNDAYQLWNSILALGSGGWLGIGFTESRLKAKYLPEAHTDFILSIVGEELGLISTILVITAYLAFMFFALRISLNAKTRQGMLLGIAITTVIMLQAFINIGVVTGSLPTKGMPAPLISYGGSNLLMCLVGVGLLVSIAIETALPNFRQELLNNIWQRLSAIKQKITG
jgi:cell division protein FtsW